MTDTLEALHRTIITAPADRTVRLIYADALDETGHPVDRARAEFIRTEIACEGRPHQDPHSSEWHHRASELFERHWLAWWSPVAIAAGLPAPHVPGRRSRHRVDRSVARRPRHWPYTHTANDATIHLRDYGLSFHYRAGFPEHVQLENFDTPEGGPELVHRWGEAIPLNQLLISTILSEADWQRLHGPHLCHLAKLTFNLLPLELAPVIAESRYLAAVTDLDVYLLGATTETIRALVWAPAWKRLRALKIRCRLSPELVRELAIACRLKYLEELDLTLGHLTDLGRSIGQIVNQVLQLVIRVVPFPTVGLPRWFDFGPALEALAAAPWIRRLRRLAIRTSLPAVLRSLFGEPLPAVDSSARGELIPDSAVLMLADVLNWDKLDSLALPGAVVSRTVQDQLTARYGQRVVFV